MSYTCPDPTVLQTDLETLREQWAEENENLLNDVSVEIQNSINLFNEAVNNSTSAAIAPLKSTLLFPVSNPRTSKPWQDVDNFEYGGPDDRGYFGSSGDLGTALQFRISILQSLAPIEPEAQELLDLLKPKGNTIGFPGFYGGFQQKLFKAIERISAIEKCHLNNRAASLGIVGRAFAFAAARVGITAPSINPAGALRSLNTAPAKLTSIGVNIQAPIEEFNEQCFLLTHILNLAEIKEEMDHGLFVPPGSSPIGVIKPLSNFVRSKNRTCLVVGEPFGFLNTMTQSPGKSLFFEMTNAQISSLQPMIRLFKVIERNEDDASAGKRFNKNVNVENIVEDAPRKCKTEKEIEITFDTHFTADDITRMFSSNGVRGTGVGLKNFSFSYEADNPFALKKSISAKLVLMANSFSELLYKRTATNGTDEYSYIDLALKTGGSDTINLSRAQASVAIDNLEKLNFRLKAVVGWQVPVASRGLFSSEMIDAIYDSAITINLTPTVHEFDIDDNGKVNFTINYLAYSEDYFDNSNFNIFTKKEVLEKQLERQLLVKKLGGDCDVDTFNKFKNDQARVEEIEQEKAESLTHLIDSLLASGKVYFMKMQQSDIDLYRVGGTYSAAANLHNVASLKAIMQSIPATRRTSAAAAEAADIQQTIDSSAERLETSDTREQDPEVLTDITPNDVSFFYASDLIDVILENIESSFANIYALSPKPGSFTKSDLADLIKRYKRLEENFHKLRIVLGPLELSESNSYSTKVSCLGDIPISVKSFLEFLTTKMLAKESSEYYLTNFLNDFFNEFIVNLLNRDICYNGRGTQRLFLFQSALTDFRDSVTDDDTLTKAMKSSTCNNYKFASPPSTFVRRLYLDNENKPPPPITPCTGLTKPVLRVMGVRHDPRVNTGICSEMNYLCYYAGRSIPMNQVIGCKFPTTGNEGIGCYNENNQKVSDTGDHDRGIWHYQIGKDRGIVKTINLSKTDSTGLAEVRFEQEGYDGLRQLRVLYDVNIKSFLDVSSFPGSYIYVEPRGFDIKGKTADGFDLTQLGIGGYHMITKTDHVIQPGMAETTISAKWVASRDTSDIVDLEQQDPNKPRKCRP